MESMKYISSGQSLNCIWLCDPMNCSTPGACPPLSLRVCLNSRLLSQWCYPTISSSITRFSLCFQSFPVSGSFPMSRLMASDGQSIQTSASASVLPMNIQYWFPWGLTDLISLQSKGLSQEYSPTPQFRSINSLALSLLYGPTLTSIHGYWKNHSFD